MNILSVVFRHSQARLAMGNEKLIELVREFTFLYNLNDKRYSDNQKKDTA
jgi:hypothetical protein